ncbi:OmpW/AlkL family protein [Biformimicrobium ophioploci]|uniref:Outer membrane beta-barrel protein n=1 Tax=Biformimicrobium ophioploci TaxID=3036711 RepID=A0ABQ6LV80_9GAMM|nr:OmpW family outer membrane protein [Microbulbifer sp. NKW57]GMG85984.1 outer membrane beta-barrel protein [Microbulbifer sp. NKW57]
MKSLPTLACGLLLGASISLPALADYERETIVLRAGIGHVDPYSESGNVSLDDLRLEGTSIDVDTGTSLSLTGSFFFNEHFAVGLLAAWPFEHDLKVEGLPDLVGDNDFESFGSVDLGTIDHLPPTVTLQWFPRCSWDWIQPYVGIGLNYTTFFDEDLSDVTESYLETHLGAVTRGSLELDDSWGAAGELGVDFLFGDEKEWLVNFSVWAIDIDSDATITYDTEESTGSNGEVVRVSNKLAVDVEIDPWVYSIGIGYRF